MSYGSLVQSFERGATFLSHSLRFDESRLFITFLIANATVLSIYIGSKSLCRKDIDGLPVLHGVPIIGSWSFFTRRHRFVHDGIAKLGEAFSFNFLQHRVILVSGAEARKTYFAHKDLNFTEGYKILSGPSPKVEDIKVETIEDDDGDNSKFRKRLQSIIRPDRLEKALPAMLRDLDRCMDKWETTGRFNPFDDIYQMVFQITCRAISCREIADDPSLVTRIAELYRDIDEGGTATAVLFPWFPSPARLRKEKATTNLYLLLKDVVSKRIEDGYSEEDPAQTLLDNGDDVNDVVTFIIGALFAGILNTGIIASWLTLYLGANPEWKGKVLSQTRSFVAKYAPGNGSLGSQLAHLPLNVWEEEMSALEACLRETMRITLTGTFLRRVVPTGETDDVTIMGKRIPAGSFVAYPVTDTHLNPSIYANPETWDPSRYDRGEDRNAHWAFLGWGVGHHPCLGMRLAKLEVKMIIALFLMQYDYELVDAAGKPVHTLPGPDRRNDHRILPIKPVYIQYKRFAAN